MSYKLLFLDTETTGNESKDHLCQVAYSIDGTRKSALFKPPVPISIESMAVHHITPKMVADKPAFKFSFEYDELKKLLHDENVILVAHNAVFDIGMLEKEGLKVPRFICTLRVARHLDAEEKISSYRLQYLRYLLELEVEAIAHDAMGDVLVLEKLFERLLKRMTENTNGIEDLALVEMMDISSHPSLVKSFKFGKYNGIRLEEVIIKDRGYLEWLLVQKTENGGDDEDWIYTLKYYLGK
jgi:DNA polymerase III epsilon subunit-like protein